MKSKNFKYEKCCSQNKHTATNKTCRAENDEPRWFRWPSEEHATTQIESQEVNISVDAVALQPRWRVREKQVYSNNRRYNAPIVLFDVQVKLVCYFRWNVWHKRQRLREGEGGTNTDVSEVNLCWNGKVAAREQPLFRWCVCVWLLGVRLPQRTGK